MSNYVQPDFRVPNTGGSVNPVSANALQVGPTPTGFLEHPDFRKLPTVKGVADYVVTEYTNVLVPSGPGPKFIQPGTKG